MKIAIIFALFILCVCTDTATAGRRWPRISNVVVKTSVTMIGDGFEYGYTIRNSMKNTYPLNVFQLDLRLNPQSHPLSRQDLTRTHTAQNHDEILEKAQKLTIGRELTPDGWKSIYPGLWGVDGLIQKYMLQPGKALSGYGFVSGSSPGIREFAVDADSWHFFNNPEEYDFPGRKLKREGDPDEFTTEVNKGIQFLGKTIAPVAPPEPFTASSWIARMNVDAVEARKLGWIKTDKNLAEIRKLIDDLKINDPDKLKTAVEKISTYVLSEKKKGNLTDEADALVRLNAEYFLRRTLQEEK